MISKDFFNALNDLEEQKNINKEEFIKILEAALTSAYKRILAKQNRRLSN